MTYSAVFSSRPWVSGTCLSLMALSGTSGVAWGEQLDEGSKIQPDNQMSEQSESIPANLGDAEGAQEVARRGPDGISFSLDFNAGFNTETDFDSGVGSIESLTAGVDLGILVPIDDRARMTLSFGGQITDYDIKVEPGVVGTNAATVGTQFDSVAEWGADGMYFRSINDTTSFFVGGGIGVAREGDADDALVWRVLGGVTYQINKNLQIGGGIGVFSQIEDDVQIIPLPQIRWTIDERWSLRSEGPGIKLQYEWADDLSMGVMAKFNNKSFRIDSDNTLVPDGAVEVQGVPLTYYLDYRLSGSERSSPNLSLFAEVGVVVAGSMEILNSSGNLVVDDDIDPTLFASFGLKIRF
ncbi:MAG: hypothetical protein AB8C13_04105 [Phycisphaerales bacterium]